MRHCRSRDHWEKTVLAMNKARFLETLRSERAQWETLLTEIDEAHMTLPGVAGEWSVKDIIAHVTAYERGVVEWLGAAARGEVLELPELDQPDVEQRNAVIFTKYRARPLPEVLWESQQVFAQLLELVESLPEADLLDPARTEWFVIPRWQQSRPLWRCIADDSYRHYQQHLPDILTWLNQTEK